MKAQIGLTLFLSLFFVVGFAMLYSGLRSLYRGRQANSWPTVEGRIIDSTLEQKSGDESTTYSVKVRYAYSVAGGGFEGDQIAFGYTGSSNFQEHRALSDKLQTGSRVMVHYDPEQPTRAVLATGFNRSTLFILIFAVTWLLFVSGFGYLMLTSKGRDNSLLNKIQIVNSTN